MPGYKISEIRGIKGSQIDKLIDAGVRTTASLLKKGAGKKGRSILSEQTGIEESLLLCWVNIADLSRIKGIGVDYACLLNECGVDTIKELRNRNAENLYAKLTEINNHYRRVRQMPNLKQVKNWIEQAKQTEPLVTY